MASDSHTTVSNNPDRGVNSEILQFTEALPVTAVLKWKINPNYPGSDLSMIHLHDASIVHDEAQGLNTPAIAMLNPLFPQPRFPIKEWRCMTFGFNAEAMLSWKLGDPDGWEHMFITQPPAKEASIQYSDGIVDRATPLQVFSVQRMSDGSWRSPDDRCSLRIMNPTGIRLQDVVEALKQLIKDLESDPEKTKHLKRVYLDVLDCVDERSAVVAKARGHMNPKSLGEQKEVEARQTSQ